MKPVVVISADGHAGAQPQVYGDYMEARYSDAIDELCEENRAYVQLTTVGMESITDDLASLIDREGAIRSGGELGGWDLSRRLEELDRDGIAGEVIIAGHQCAVQPFFSIVNKPYSAELRAAGSRAYHRWLADMMADASGRLIGVAEAGPCLDMGETVRELRWVAEHGFKSVSLPGNTADSSLPILTDSYFDPFWAACADLGLILSIHAGWGQPQGKIWEFARLIAETLGRDASLDQQRAGMMEALSSSDDSPLRLDMGPRQAMWQLMLSGVLDRYSQLKLVLTEVRSDWLPATLQRLEHHYKAGRAPFKRSPLEYWEQNCFVTPSSIHCCEVEDRHEIGVGKLMFGSDYPHPESTWPNTLDWLRACFDGVPEKEARQILGETARECYGFDQSKIEAVAARIGPGPHEILGNFDIDERLLHHFDQRAGLRRPAEAVDVDQVDLLLDADVRAISTE